MLSVILKSSVRGLGKAGEVAKVRPGYARYLLAEGRAVRATKQNMELLSERIAQLEGESNKKLEEAKAVAEALNKECLVIVRQASDDGRLFGSVTVRDVARLMQDLGYSVQPKEVFFGEVIKRVGVYEVNVELHADFVAVVKLHVVQNEAKKANLSAIKERENARAMEAEAASENASEEVTEEEPSPESSEESID